MARGGWAEAFYPAVELFIQRSLREGASFVTGEPGAWTVQAADDFYERFVVHEHLGPAGFSEKLSSQLEGASRKTVLLAADLVCVCTLPVHDMGAAAKLKRLQAVLLPLVPEPEIDDRVRDAFTTGIASYGAGKAVIWKYMRYLAEFARSWSALGEAERTELLGDAWKWKSLLAGIPSGGAQSAALAHMVFPEVFEPIVSVDSKAAIGRAFAGIPGVEEEADVDRKLGLIRSALEPVLGTEFHFWETSVQPVWQGKADDRAWDFARFAIEFRRLPNFEEDEIDYKLELAGRLAASRQAVLSNEADWLNHLRRAFAAPNNITNWRHHDAFLKWCEARPDEAKAALVSLWSPESAQAADIAPFLAAVLDQTSDSPGDRANIASYLLGAWDPQDWVNYKATRSDRALRLCDLEPAETRDVAERITRFSSFIDQLRVRVIALGGRPVSRLEAQGMTWFVVSDFVPEEWSAEQRAKLAAFRAGRNWGDTDTGGDGPRTALPAISEAFARSLLLPMAWLEDIRSLLEEKGQAIFFGPPGTGKTWVAQKLAHYFAGEERYELVQFHPSYAYEDFVQGYRPTTSDGLLSYELRDGALLRIAERARNDPDGSPHVLVIDEINRGNIAKIFGELLFLLEYRDRSIALQYSDEFTFPENLYVIGTMNTADRSIALVDTALRRRFYFVEFSPTSAELKGVLRTWLTDNHLSTEPADLLDALNAKLEALEGGHDFTIGPSYFMVDGGADLDHVWRHAIRPVLIERFYGRKTPSEIDTEFGFAALRGADDTIEDSEPLLESGEDEGLDDTAV